MHEAMLKLVSEHPEIQKFPVIERLFTLITNQAVNIEVRQCERGVELRFTNEVNGTPNRAHLRIVLPFESKCVLFFHKKSSVPFSRDRFSYGGVVIDARSYRRFNDEHVQQWLDFALSGLSPSARPSSLLKTLPYTIPED